MTNGQENGASVPHLDMIKRNSFSAFCPLLSYYFQKKLKLLDSIGDTKFSENLAQS
jgi:hypothetical protein